MSLTLSQPITTARGILNDPSAVRYSNADLLRYANDSLDQIVMLAPRLFHADGEVECVAGRALQSIGFEDALSLVLVRRVVGGAAITPVDRAALDAYFPGWHESTPGEAVHWIAVEGDPLRFMVYPPAPESQVLEVMYVRVPGEYADDEIIDLPASLSDAISDYIVYRAESRDDEHINSNRAAQFLASFVQKVKG